MSSYKMYAALPFLAVSFSGLFAAAASAQQEMPPEMAAAASTKIEPVIQESPEKPADQASAVLKSTAEPAAVKTDAAPAEAAPAAPAEEKK